MPRNGTLDASMETDTIIWSGAFDLFVCGQKGLAAAKLIARVAPQKIRQAFVARDSKLADDPFDEIVQILARAGIPIMQAQGAIPDSDDTVGLAIGWRSLVSTHYHAILVIHDSLLPDLRGWNPLVTSLREGRKKIGVTLFKADENIDCGPILDQVAIDIEPPIKISDAIELIGRSIDEILLRLFRLLPQEGYKLQAQEQGSATYSLWRDKFDYWINWSESAEAIQRHIYAVGQPYLGATTLLNGIEVVIKEAVVVKPDLSIANRSCGKILQLTTSGPVVVCGEGLLQVTEMNPKFNELNRKVRQRFHSPCYSCLDRH